MAVIPQTRLEQIQFSESHIPVWTVAPPTTIGLTAAQVAALDGLTQDARKAFDAAVAARQASKAATSAMYDAVAQMRDKMADMVRSIKTFAEASANPGTVYSAAQIPAPLPPSQVPPPGTPFDFKVELLQSGSVRINWKCTNPEGAGGTIYEVFRGPQGGTLNYVGSTGIKEFVDDTLPRSVVPLSYRFVAVRSTRRGDPAMLTVSFGVAGGGGGGFTITGVTGGELAGAVAA
jgi:hypothetical protein